MFSNNGHPTQKHYHDSYVFTDKHLWMEAILICYKLGNQYNAIPRYFSPLYFLYECGDNAV